MAGRQVTLNASNHGSDIPTESKVQTLDEMKSYSKGGGGADYHLLKNKTSNPGSIICPS